MHFISIELLLEWKANVRAVDSSKNTALHLACQRRHPAAASVLLNWIDLLAQLGRLDSSGTDNTDASQAEQQRAAVINMTNKQERTPLHLAARNGLVTVSLLPFKYTYHMYIQ